MVLLMVSPGAGRIFAILLSTLMLLGGLPFVAAEDAEGDAAEPDYVFMFAGATSDVRWRVSPDGDGCKPLLCGALSTMDSNDQVTWVMGPWNASVETVVVELRYDSDSQIPLSRLALAVACQDPPSNGSCTFEAHGTGLLQIRLDRDDLAQDGIDLAQAWSMEIFVDEGWDVTGTGTVTLGAAYQQNYEGAVSIFSSGPAPDDYSFFR